ncbi:Cytochrome oxidase biogenesis protein Sco1/SenC/PrrC, putative copper metallochaperone [hydrothermal vent metagenome]|uniref:Cytochrome oxidase biogenesis protein Sco1/SenC/PrrC, putative copper metallochaperone n=1 Tax=hydrothermal vent metagenome TaxID=652676 RepID=A0A3B0ZRJ4_9ZZZZ
MSLIRTLATSITISLSAASFFYSGYALSSTEPAAKKSDATKTQAVTQPAAKAKPKKRKSRYGANYFPNYVLTTQDGEKMKFFDDVIEDKVVIINFIFTSCKSVCPLETARLKEVYDLLDGRVGKDVFFYSISIDPARDTPEVMKAYMEKYGIANRPGWNFLTGKKEEVDIIRTKLGLKIDDLVTSEDGEIDHNISLVIGNQATGKWVKRSPYEASQVLATMVGDWMHNWSNPVKISSKDYKHAKSVQNYSDGAYIYRTRCLLCHSIGQGDGIGPDLLGVTKRRETNWLARWLLVPDVMLKEKDPIAMEMFEKFDQIPMPNLRLSDIDVKAILEYLTSIDNPEPEPAVDTNKLESIDGK